MFGVIPYINKLLIPYSPSAIIFGTILIASGLYKLADIYLHWPQYKRHFQKKLYRLLFKIPFLKNKIEAELKKALKPVESEILKRRKFRYTELPAKPVDTTTILTAVAQDTDSTELGYKMSGGIYVGSDLLLLELNAEIFKLAAYVNPLHSDAWPNMAQQEAEVISWCAKLYHGDKHIRGNITEGGTRSILEACRVHQAWAYETKNICQPNMIAPATIHPAFDKAAQDYGIELIKVPVSPITGKVDPKEVESKINKNTILLLASAPCFPTGIIDPIAELSDIAHRHQIGLHVDACLGGFILPFMSAAGFDPGEIFDFRLKGVTSISMDTHKYGYCVKGSSVVLFRPEIGQYQTYAFLKSPIGMYVTPNQAGSRSGAMISMVWATLLAIGFDKYTEITQKIILLKQHLVDSVRSIPELEVIGDPKLSVFAFNSPNYNIYLLTELMKQLGWVLNTFQNPPGCHFCITAAHLSEGFADEFIRDLKRCVAWLIKHPDAKPSKEGATYAKLDEIPSLLIGPAGDDLGRRYRAIVDRSEPKTPSPSSPSSPHLPILPERRPSF